MITQFPDSIFCEANYTLGVAEPGNSYSNIAYILLGIFLIYKYKSYQAKIYGTSMILLGVCSFTFHATYNAFGAWLDVAGMAAMAGVVIKLIIGYHLPNKSNQIAIISTLSVIVANGIILLSGWHWGWLVMPILLQTIVALGLILHTRPRFTASVFLSALSFSFAGLSWLLDFLKLWCISDQHLVSGHLLWHIFTAVGLTFLFHYLQEPSTTSKV